MQQGDLVHIPEGVTLFGLDSAILDRTNKPTVGVFLKESTLSGWLSGTYTVYALGREAVVKKRHIYPMGESNGPS